MVWRRNANGYSSVKWVGMFGTALVGLYTIEELWTKFGDLRMSKVRYLMFQLQDMYTDCY